MFNKYYGNVLIYSSAGGISDKWISIFDFDKRSEVKLWGLHPRIGSLLSSCGYMITDYSSRSTTELEDLKRLIKRLKFDLVILLYDNKFEGFDDDEELISIAKACTEKEIQTVIVDDLDQRFLFKELPFNEKFIHYIEFPCTYASVVNEIFNCLDYKETINHLKGESENLFEFDDQLHIVTYNNNDIPLTDVEYAIFKHLFKYRNQYVTSANIIEKSCLDVDASFNASHMQVTMISICRKVNQVYEYDFLIRPNIYGYVLSTKR